MAKITGGLLDVLRVSSAASYRGRDGTQAYFEAPTPEKEGALYINGVKVSRLVISLEEIDPWRPTENLQRMILAYGVDLDIGWTGNQDVYGEHINTALKKSACAAVRHHGGRICVQKINEQEVMIYLNGREHWQVRLAVAHNALEELGVPTWTGWYPVQQSLIHPRVQEYQRRVW